MKNLPIYILETEDENRKTSKNILALWESWWALKDHVASEKSLHLMIEDWGEKLKKWSNNEKSPKLDEEIWEENSKIIDCRYY